MSHGDPLLGSNPVQNRADCAASTNEGIASANVCSIANSHSHARRLTAAIDPRDMNMRTALLVVGVALVALLSITSAAPVAIGTIPSATAPPPQPPLSIVPPPPSGSYPDFVFVGDVGNLNGMTIDLGLAQTGAWNVPNTNGVGIYDPEQWVVVFYYNNITVPFGKVVSFKNHPSRAAVALLASGSMNLLGSLISVGAGSALPYDVTEPGPGGFRGGKRGHINGGAIVLPSAGQGPGGGFQTLQPSPLQTSVGAGGSHRGVGVAASPSESAAGSAGPSYGSGSVRQLIGGSGSAGGLPPYQDCFGAAGGSGGGGGGALLLAANQSIIGGFVSAAGAYSECDQFGYDGWRGAGGTLRVVAAHVDPALSVYLGAAFGSADGWVRIEKNNAWDSDPSNGVWSIATGNAANAVLFETQGRASVTVLSIGGMTCPADPRAGFLAAEAPDIWGDVAGPVEIVLQGRNVPVTSLVFLRSTLSSGTTAGETQIVAPAVGNDALWTRTTVVDVPAGTVCFQARARLQ